jgi:polyhydroxyalkanoate synthesis regulator phasin
LAAFQAPAPAVPAPNPSPAATAPATPAENRARLAKLAAQSVREGDLTEAQADAILAAVDRKTKPSDAEIDKRVSDLKLPFALAELLREMIRSGDLDINLLPSTWPVFPAAPHPFERDVGRWRN